MTSFTPINIQTFSIYMNAAKTQECLRPFQQEIFMVYFTIKLQIVFVPLNTIFVFIRTPWEDIIPARKVQNLLGDAKQTVKPTNCVILSAASYILEQRFTRPTPKTLSSNWCYVQSAPTDKRYEVRALYTLWMYFIFWCISIQEMLRYFQRI